MNVGLSGSEGQPSDVSRGASITVRKPRRYVSTDESEFAVYAALKLYVYERLARTFERAVAANAVPILSVRRMHKLLSGRASRSPEPRPPFTEFFDISAHFIRERMKALNHGTVLQAVGRGLRGAVHYRWTEPLSEASGRSFRELQRALPRNTHFAPDLFRIFDSHGQERFSVEEFLSGFRALRSRLVARRWYDLNASGNRDALQYTRFLENRLAEYVRLGLVEAVDGRFRLSDRGMEAALWFEVFAYSAPFRSASA